ncbi:hypothetical protein GP475_10375 [Corynebacterium poyangense]|uniref:Uncharacterized protein n=1 Tax=Corynebacterium poyangense TaxID=2684405 RepID=A0A7H0SR17_9CORY|nr:hypothetical protein [Corynebacterium poyangense]MBZ8176412.1 hypothetical protein [Corynebacterium poyangense]QNQ90992.1 hypothetical protein GP475_10375 [Corynebacterium poyangense]
MWSGVDAIDGEASSGVWLARCRQKAYRARMDYLPCRADIAFQVVRWEETGLGVQEKAVGGCGKTAQGGDTTLETVSWVRLVASGNLDVARQHALRVDISRLDYHQRHNVMMGELNAIAQGLSAKGTG